jgi:hypothetical protein
MKPTSRQNGGDPDGKEASRCRNTFNRTTTPAHRQQDRSHPEVKGMLLRKK